MWRGFCYQLILNADIVSMRSVLEYYIILVQCASVSSSVECGAFFLFVVVVLQALTYPSFVLVCVFIALSGNGRSLDVT